MSVKEQKFLDVISGRRRGVGADAARVGLGLVEPVYAGVMRFRNRLFDKGIRKVHRAGCPVISIGNITTGGTGKTPVVHWLAESLADGRIRPAVLMRGYKSRDGSPGDEQKMLLEVFRSGGNTGVVVHANPDRVTGAAEIVRDHPEVNVIVLDDGFQHRRLARDFDLVLIDATSPFGFGHVIPRGLLREPLAGLARADAIVITRSDLVPKQTLIDAERTIREKNSTAPVFRAYHVLEGFSSADKATTPPEGLSGKRAFAFCGIGNPDSFYDLLRSAGGTLCGFNTFSDHHAYTRADVSNVMCLAEKSGAELLVTTEKDWAKLSTLIDWKTASFPICRTRLRIRFHIRDEYELLALIQARLNQT